MKSTTKQVGLIRYEPGLQHSVHSAAVHMPSVARSPKMCLPKLHVNSRSLSPLRLQCACEPSNVKCGPSGRGRAQSLRYGLCTDDGSGSSPDGHARAHCGTRERHEWLTAGSLIALEGPEPFDSYSSFAQWWCEWARPLYAERGTGAHHAMQTCP